MRDLIKEDILKPTQKRFIVYQMLRAIKYLHSADLVHGSLTTSHILVNNMCEVKLNGFGKARRTQQKRLFEPSENTEGCDGQRYDAPEVTLSGKYTKAADIWSLGCIIAEMLIG